MKKFDIDSILQMSSEEFAETFSKKYVVIFFNNAKAVEGKVTKIGLSATPNMDSRDHLPVSISIGLKSYSIQDIQCIKVC